MSHFSVLVVTDTPSVEELEWQLQPFHEYECDGIEDEFVEWVDCHDEVLNDFPKYMEDYENVDVFAAEWFGYEKRDGRFGRFTNPNAEWDWWTIGGRWSDHLMTHSGKSVDHAYRKDIAVQAMWDRAYDAASANLDDLLRVLGEAPSWRSWETIRAKYDQADFSLAREEYWGQEQIKRLSDSEEFRVWASYDCFLSPSYETDEADASIATYAFLQDRQWTARGKMGWWGISSEPNAQYSFKDLLDKVHPDKYCWVVDCHI